MKKRKILRESFRAILLMAAVGLAGAAVAQPSINVTSAAGPTGATGLSVTVEFTDTVPASTEVIDVRLDLDASIVTNIDLTGCNGNTINGITVQCSNPNPGQVNILVFPFPPAAIDSGTIGTIAFDISNSAPIGVSPIEFIFEEYTGAGSADITPVPTDSTLGTITVQAPAGGFYSSTPAPGAELDLGEAVVNSLASPVQTLTVDNASTDPFNITGFSTAAAQLTLPAGSFVVPAGGAIDFDGVTEDAVACTPSVVGPNTGSFAVAHDAAGGAASPVSYDFTCKGLAPNVDVTPTTITLNGSIGGTAPTDTFDISNLDTVGETTSDAENVQLAEAGQAEISVTNGLTDNILLVDEVDFVEVSCSTVASGTFSKTITVSWNDPVLGGTASQDVTVNCEILNVAPGYTSSPAVPGPLAFGSVPNGTSSTLTIDIGNADSAGTGTGAQLEISGATLSDSTNYSFSPNPFTATLPAGAPNGTESLDVTCEPSGVGIIPAATLTVQTNDGDQVYNLSCEGTGDVLTSTPPAGGTLNLGTVPPGTSTGEGLISFTNNSIDGSVQVDCTVTDTAGVFSVTPASPFSFTIDPGLTESAAFQCTPTDVSSFTADVSCTTGVRGTLGFNYTVTCAGRPLVIPTMSRWGLVVMSLVLLLVAGVAGRRMLA